MIDKVIGIISYLPDNKNIRDQRRLKLDKLIKDLNSIFGLPIMIIAQNWSHNDIHLTANCQVFYSDKLGITGARIKLREKFLESNYDYLIMIDDDIELVYNNGAGKDYLNMIDKNPNKYGIFRGTLLQLFAISKTIFKEINYDADVEAENGDGFEDTIFVTRLQRKFPDKQFNFSVGTNLNWKGLQTRDPLSTWYKDQNLKEMLDKTAKIKNEIK